ncbi:MAG: SCP2 sterol-binding domain-containing protein [Clostridia bacterium]|nr:SCP2 sterol-binding domain-containing protein [Clostridia bacterium]
MEELKKEIQSIISSLADGISFPELMEKFCDALKAHPEALAQLAGSYRLTTTDSGLNMGFSLGKNGFALLADDEKADATISGSEANLMALIRRELNPMVAMFTGKLNVQGSMQALSKFAQIL